MSPKVILVPLNGHPQDNATLEYAFNLAETFDATVQGWHIAPNPETMAASYAYEPMMVYPEASIREMEEANKTSIKLAEEKFFITARNLKATNASFHSSLGFAGDIVAERGRVADLIVASRTDEGMNGNGLINGALFGSGHPVLLIPPDNQAKDFNGNILIAWNGSLEATHAIAFALPYMKRGKVWALTETNGETKQSPLSVEDLANYLRPHGIEVDKALINMREGPSPPASILNTAKTLNVDMIVMGAWGHSRIREYIFGGTTDFMLRHTDIPVFMAH